MRASSEPRLSLISGPNSGKSWYTEFREISPEEGMDFWDPELLTILSQNGPGDLWSSDDRTFRLIVALISDVRDQVTDVLDRFWSVSDSL